MCMIRGWRQLHINANSRPSVAAAVLQVGQLCMKQISLVAKLKILGIRASSSPPPRGNHSNEPANPSLSGLALSLAAVLVMRRRDTILIRNTMAEG